MLEHYPPGIEIHVEPEPAGGKPGAGGGLMLSPVAAWRSLCARTGGFVTKATFYRWLRDGRVYSIRLGQRIFIPQTALDDLIKTCLAGEKF
ncbi:MAG TPA: hypothetical protein VFM21_05540 [Terriglobia bacterium]|nr:hypothetical protein [Terriglobia bacterium]